MKKLIAIAALGATMFVTGCASNLSSETVNTAHWENFQGNPGGEFQAQKRYTGKYSQASYEFRGVNDSADQAACYKMDYHRSNNYDIHLAQDWVLIGPGETGHLGYIEQSKPFAGGALYSRTEIDAFVRIRMAADGEAGPSCSTFT